MLKHGFYNMDCMDGMKEFPDKYFDLAIVDPPYGIGYDKIAEKAGGTKSKNAAAEKKVYHGGGWDDSPPNDAYFAELFRVSKAQIIWGGTTLSNYHHQSHSYAGINDAMMTCETILLIASLRGHPLTLVLQEYLGTCGTACCKAI